jgi:O-antigen ligase
MLRKNTIFNFLLLCVVLIFCGVIIYAAIILCSIEIGITLLPLVLFIAITYLITKKSTAKNHA